MGPTPSPDLRSAPSSHPRSSGRLTPAPPQAGGYPLLNPHRPQPVPLLNPLPCFPRTSRWWPRPTNYLPPPPSPLKPRAPLQKTPSFSALRSGTRAPGARSRTGPGASGPPGSGPPPPPHLLSRFPGPGPRTHLSQCGCGHGRCGG